MKLVYASTFFARRAPTGARRIELPEAEKMAVIVQEVVGRRHGDRFYPDISGVARSYNFYPAARAARRRRREPRARAGQDDRGRRAHLDLLAGPPAAVPPPFTPRATCSSETQTEFWAVNMGEAARLRPDDREPSTSCSAALGARKRTARCSHVASTYDPESDRLVPGDAAARGRACSTSRRSSRSSDCRGSARPRSCSAVCAKRCAAAGRDRVRASPFPDRAAAPARVPAGAAARGLARDVDCRRRTTPRRRGRAPPTGVLGNGTIDGVRDVVYVRPRGLRGPPTPAIADEVEAINRALVVAGRPYVLVGFGRWGSSTTPGSASRCTGARSRARA